MANKKAILNQLADFFAKQGKVLTPSEYKALGADAPIRFMSAKRHQKQNLKQLQRQHKQLPKKLKSEVDNGENFSLD